MRNTVVLFVFKVAYDFEKFKIDEAKVCVCVCVCICVCVCVCVPLASESSETINVIIIKLSTVTASDMEMHHVLIILPLPFIHGHNCVSNLIRLTRTIIAISRTIFNPWHSNLA